MENRKKFIATGITAIATLSSMGLEPSTGTDFITKPRSFPQVIVDKAPEVAADTFSFTQSCSQKEQKDNQNFLILGNLQRLQDIKKLPDGWDGEYSKSIPGQVLFQAKVILMNLSYQPELYPTGRESVQIQYEKRDRSYLEFEIFTNHIDMLYVPKRHYKEAVTKKLSSGDWYLISGIVNQFFEV